MKPPEHRPPAASRDESARLAALARYEILDTPPEKTYDDITTLAAQLCETPTALITLLDESRQWFKSRVGLDIGETPRDIAFCDTTIRGASVFEVSDASGDDRFRSNPLVTGPPNIRFYAGAPLTTRDGYNLGALCVIDSKKRVLTPEQRAALETLARQVSLQLELRYTLTVADRARRRLAAEVERRTESEAARARAEAFQRETIDALPDHIAIVEPSGIIIYVNNAWDTFARDNTNTAEFRAKLCVGANYLAVCAGAAADGHALAAETRDMLQRALDGGLEDEFNRVYACHGKNEKRWFIQRLSSFHDGAQRYAVVSHQNITDRVIAERKIQEINATLEARVEARTAELDQAYASLRASEERFRALFENAAVAYATISADGRMDAVNAAFCTLTQQREPDLKGQRLSELVHSDDAEIFEALLGRTLSGQIPGFVRETRIVRSGGEEIWVHASFAAVTDASGRPNQSVVIMQNISPRKIAEYERDQFFDLSVDMFIIASLDGTIHRVNPACSRILGYAEDELLSMRYPDLVHPDDGERIAGVLAALTEGRATEIPYTDVRMRVSDGKYREFRWSAALWIGEQRILGVGRDITHMRASERALRALAARLQDVREEERTRISREIHDELGQMLTALKMDISLLERDVRREESTTPLDPRIAHELESMKALVDATLASVKRIAQQLRPEELDVLGLLPAIEWQAKRLETRGGLRCRLLVNGPTPALTEQQSTELFRIVQEALTNVTRHADADNVEIAFDTRNGKLMLTIRDDGRGFDTGDLARMSLGLLGMRERATGIGASLNIASTLGEGTVVALDVPLSSGTVGAPP